MPSTATTQRMDLYPSRVDDKARLLERQDPAVHGDASDGPLSPEQVGQFERDGALLLENVFSSDEVQRFSDRLAELSADPTVRADDRTITEPESDEVRSIFEVHKTDELFQKVAADARVADAARQLLGSDVYIHQSRINFKPGFPNWEVAEGTLMTNLNNAVTGVMTPRQALKETKAYVDTRGPFGF